MASLIRKRVWLGAFWLAMFVFFAIPCVASEPVEDDSFAQGGAAWELREWVRNNFLRREAKSLKEVLEGQSTSKPSRRYAEEQVYWERVYRGLYAKWKGKVVTQYGGHPVEAVPGVTVWGPKVEHVALLPTKMPLRDISFLKGTQFPLYCGYIVYGQDNSFTFVKKTDIQLPSIDGWLRKREENPAVGEKEFYEFSRSAFPRMHLYTVKTFYGLYGMDFVPKFKKTFTLDEQPSHSNVFSFLELENGDE